jgi:hypothetical protein
MPRRPLQALSTVAKVHLTSCLVLVVFVGNQIIPQVQMLYSEQPFATDFK